MTTTTIGADFAETAADTYRSEIAAVVDVAAAVGCIAAVVVVVGFAAAETSPSDGSAAVATVRRTVTNGCYAVHVCKSDSSRNQRKREREK